MTAKEIREKETSHLQAELLEQHKHLYDLRSQAVTEKLEDPSQLRKTKKDIARIKTILRQRELEETNKNGKSETTKSAGETSKTKKSATAAKRRKPTTRGKATAGPKRRATAGRSKKVARSAKKTTTAKA